MSASHCYKVWTEVEVGILLKCSNTRKDSIYEVRERLRKLGFVRTEGQIYSKLVKLGIRRASASHDAQKNK